jgi:hypothetical protein
MSWRKCDSGGHPKGANPGFITINVMITIRFVVYVGLICSMLMLLGCQGKSSGGIAGKWKSVDPVSGEYGDAVISLDLAESGDVTMVTDFLEMESNLVSSGTFEVRGEMLILNLVRHSGQDGEQGDSYIEEDQVELLFNIVDGWRDGLILRRPEDKNEIAFRREER